MKKQKLAGFLDWSLGALMKANGNVLCIHKLSLDLQQEHHMYI